MSLHTIRKRTLTITRWVNKKNTRKQVCIKLEAAGRAGKCVRHECVLRGCCARKNLLFQRQRLNCSDWLHSSFELHTQNPTVYILPMHNFARLTFALFHYCYCCIYSFLHCWHSVDSKRKHFIVQGNMFPYCAYDIKHFESWMLKLNGSLLLIIQKKINVSSYPNLNHMREQRLFWGNSLMPGNRQIWLNKSTGGEDWCFNFKVAAHFCPRLRGPLRPHTLQLTDLMLWLNVKVNVTVLGHRVCTWVHRAGQDSASPHLSWADHQSMLYLHHACTTQFTPPKKTKQKSKRFMDFKEI